MPRLPVRVVSLAELQQFFNELELWSQIHHGTLTSDVITESPATNPRYGGGISQMLVHRDDGGRHVCTTHRIIDASGNVLHWDEADVKLSTETVAKAHQQPAT